jgi:hypothetical protein
MHYLKCTVDAKISEGLAIDATFPYIEATCLNNGDRIKVTICQTAFSGC